MENTIITLFKDYFGEKPDHTELLPASGSARKYYRIFTGQSTYIGAENPDVTENRLFINFSRHFKEKGLHVPEIYAVSENQITYIQEDLGTILLLDVAEQSKNGKIQTSLLTDYYRKSLAELLRFQFIGNEGLDYSHCVPRPIFDKKCIQWDLNYFKYCFLRLAGANFSEEALENDFERLIDRLCKAENNYFMFRDFQSRNIMIHDGDVWFIDYQGGRQGALQYDVASLLYDAIIDMPEQQREELLDYYVRELQQYKQTENTDFRKNYYPFVLIRLLQAMGAFGLRGLYERKQHFIDSIIPGLQNIKCLLESGKLGEDYPEIEKTIQKVIHSTASWKTERKEG